MRAAKLPRRLPTGALALLVIAPVATAAPLLGGYGGQLGVVEYPAEWAEVEAATAGCDGTMVVLPWHLYMDASWIPNDDKRITQPAKMYFSCPTLTSDDLELGGAASQASAPQVAYVAKWVADPRDDITTLGNLLSPVRARYVLLLKESDWRAVDGMLSAQGDLRLGLENARVKLYENLAPVPPIVHRADVARVGSEEEVLALSQMRLFASLALVRADVQDATLFVATPPARSPVSSWRMAGEDAVVLAFGFAPAFAADEEGPVRDAGLWRIGATTWLASIAGVVALAAWARRDYSRVNPSGRGSDGPEGASSAGRDGAGSIWAK